MNFILSEAFLSLFLFSKQNFCWIILDREKTGWNLPKNWTKNKQNMLLKKEKGITKKKLAAQPTARSSARGCGLLLFRPKHPTLCTSLQTESGPARRPVTLAVHSPLAPSQLAPDRRMQSDGSARTSLGQNALTSHPESLAPILSRPRVSLTRAAMVRVQATDGPPETALNTATTAPR